MDPLTITCSAVALIQATSSIASSLHAMVQSLRTADERIASLCDELQSLSGLLGAVDKTLSGCRPADVALVEEDLWRQSELVLMDCQMTLREMEVLVGRVREAARGDQPQPLSRGWSLRWRARAVVGLSTHGPAIAAFRDKLQKSSWALQTILHTITVSMSMRNTTSQDAVLLALSKLNSTIDDALNACVRRPADVSTQQSQPVDQSDARMDHNLRRLAEAARHFHSTASSTASTVRSSSSSSVCIDSWDVLSDTAATSLAGGLSPFQRQRIEGFIDGQVEHRCQSSSHDTFSTLIPVSSDGASSDSFARLKRSESGNENDDDDANVELDRMFLDGLEELARCHIRDGCFAKATSFLQEALKLDVSTLISTRLRRLRALSALCYIMQGDWRLAEPVVLQLAETVGRQGRQERQGPGDEQAREDLDVVGNLLHAVALGHLCAFSLDGALERCRQAWQIRKQPARQLGRDGNIDQAWEAWNDAECRNTQGLLATIYETRGDYIRAEMLWQQQPEFAYRHPANEIDFLQQHRMLLNMAVQLLPHTGAGRAPSASPGTAVMQELDGEGTPSSRPEAADSSGRENEDSASLPSADNFAGAAAFDHEHGEHSEHGPVVEMPDVQEESRLRVKLKQWERQEMDTCKEVYFGSPRDSAICLQDDAAEDAPPGSPPNRMSSLQQKLSRLLRSRKEASSVGVEKKPAAEGPERLEQHRSSNKTGTRWLGRGGSLFRKSKTLLRRRSTRSSSADSAYSEATEPCTESTEVMASCFDDDRHEHDDVCSCASTPALDFPQHWQQQQQQQQQQTRDWTVDLFYPLPELSRSGDEYQHVLWEPPLSAERPELSDFVSTNVVAYDFAGRPTTVWMTADTFLETDTEERRARRRRLKEWKRESRARQGVSDTSKRGGGNAENFGLQTGFFGTEPGADRSHDDHDDHGSILSAPYSDETSLTALVLRQLDTLYILKAARPAWLDDLGIWFDDWPEKLQTRYPAWAADGARDLGDVGDVECAEHAEDAEDAADRKERKSVAQEPTSMETEQRGLRRAFSWSSGSEARFSSQAQQKKASAGLSRECSAYLLTSLQTEENRKRQQHLQMRHVISNPVSGVGIDTTP